MSAFRQLILPFVQPPHFADADFVAAPSNHDARAWLDHPGSWPHARLVLSGPEGGGKTHLLHIWARRHDAEIRPAAAIRGLPDPPRAAALAIDDADEIACESALFHLLNLAAAAGASVLLTARTPPSLWRVTLPDLASRLRASGHVAIAAADDELLARLLLRLASDRQLEIPPAVADFLLLRLPRTQAALREAVARLDRAAMAGGGRPTRALAAAVLAAIDDAPPADHRARLSQNHDNPMIFDRIPAAPVNSASKPARPVP